MKQIVHYGKREIEYDDEVPCISCGEPVGAASMGGTVVCPSCDCGRCRYCRMTIFVMKESIDGGRSKKDLLEHMKWHNERDPKCRERNLEMYRQFHKKLLLEKQDKVK